MTCCDAGYRRRSSPTTRQASTTARACIEKWLACHDLASEGGCPPCEPGDLMHVLEDAAHRAIAYLDSLETRAVRPDRDAVARLDRLFVPVPQTPTPDADVIAHLDELVSPATMAMAGPRFFGFVIGGSLPVTVAANWLATAWDQNACFDVATP